MAEYFTVFIETHAYLICAVWEGGSKEIQFPPVNESATIFLQNENGERGYVWIKGSISLHSHS